LSLKVVLCGEDVAGKAKQNDVIGKAPSSIWGGVL